MLRRAALVVLALVAASCDDDPCADGACREPTRVMMDASLAESFFDAPFPSDARRGPDGRPDIEGFPNPSHIVLVDRVLDVVRTEVDGFGVSTGVYFRATRGLDPASLPDLHGTVAEGASVFLISVDPDAPDVGARYPVDVRYDDDPGPYGAPRLLSLVPLQGVPLRPKTRYAAFVTTRVRDADGVALAPSETVRQLDAGGAPDGMSAEVADHHRAALVTAKLAAADVAGMTVFTTGDPVSTLGKAIERARAEDLPAPSAAFTKTDDFDTFCVYASTIDMPVYQSGTAPYSDEGGAWQLDDGGAPVLQKHETARFVVTIPKTTMPAAGYPVVVFSRTGGGGDRPLVDRGVRAEPGGEAIAPGTGPALEFARAGFGGVSVDGPHGGLRNYSGGDEQFLVFNFQNPVALRDNVRQSALELALLPDVLDGVTIDVSDCAGAVAPASIAKLDTGTMALMGHSMGAAIAPLTLAYEPRYRAGLLSGAGGSFIANLMYKLKPLPAKSFGELLLGLTIAGYSLHDQDPMLSMLQWAGETADAPIYGRYVVREPLVGEPRNVLMMQGIVDHYIMPPIANATSLSMGLDLAGEELDDDAAELADLVPLGELVGLAGARSIDLPAKDNAASLSGTKVTAVVSQFPEDGVEDGHEVAFQTEPPKHAYTCFLMSLAAGPSVPSVGDVGAPCD
jgi:hypothetical protein